jgi:hypothetical protein
MRNGVDKFDPRSDTAPERPSPGRGDLHPAQTQSPEGLAWPANATERASAPFGPARFVLP